MVLKQGREGEAERIFKKWELDFAVVGTLTDTGRLVLKHKGQVAADMPVAPLSEQMPEYARPWVPSPPRPMVDASTVPAPDDIAAALRTLISCPDIASKRWIYEQYDHMVMADTLQRPGGDAAVVRIHGSDRGLALVTDCTPRYCDADPKMGGAQAVAETWRNITAVGAKPLAVTDCMNFGNPERPEIMGQFAGCIEGMAEACKALDFPVVSGNVSLYNDTGAVGVQPTPAIGGVGILDNLRVMQTIAIKAAGNALLLIGETKGHLGASLYLREVAQREDGAPPPVDLTAERRNGDFVRDTIRTGRPLATHDCSDGGLLIAVAEMAMAGGIGAALTIPASTVPLHAFLFGEDQARYVLEVPEADVAGILARAKAEDVPAAKIGTTGGAALTVNGAWAISVGDLKVANEAWLPAYMAGKA